ncbi:SIS domain-containing protein [Thermanaerothrix sp.]|jgi:arabinose-5-phosphate isomerase|uniref:KpsF/GutQ family sugar-phosphate isomerase n=1 Tax=Thermanaerothrix sp. TaxID=2972675 RepID=UPI002ADE1564|nr:SIS domain-containing protein [Thermanaerothrix sp.]
MTDSNNLSDDALIELAQEVIKREAEAVASLSPQFDRSFVKAAQALLACEGHVLVAGAGTSHAVAYRLAHLLSCCGTPALFIHPGDAQHGGGGAVTNKDVLLVISKGGETSEINHLAKIARQRGAKVIALTENPASTLGQLSDIVVRVQAPPDVDPYGMIATGSSLVNAAWGDALCVVLLQARGYTKEEFGQTHPGGAVGKKLSEQGILRS